MAFRSTVAGAALVLGLMMAATAGAQGPPAGGELPIPSPEPKAGPEQPPEDLSPDQLMDYLMRRNWKGGAARTFFSTTIDVGYLYLRPRATLGYGRPFTQWIGLDLNPLVSSGYIGIYGGVRMEIPHFNLRAGARINASYFRTFLDPLDSYDRVALDAGNNNKNVTTTLEAEAEGSLPAGPGELIGLASASYVTGVQSGKNAFEETLRIVVDPPWVLRGRAGYVLRWGSKGQHSIGLVADVLSVPARTNSLTVRAGLLVRFVLSRRIEVRGSFVPTIISPDNIGIAGSDFTELGLRYRWATE